MSVREDDRRKNCPSRGLGVAAAAIGVGVGAALYYFFSKRTENPHTEESTSLEEREEMDTLRAQALSKEEYDNFMRSQAFRQRTWSLEECSICFEVMLRDQSLMTLPCTHNFHEQCILPWLQERETCPNCRKAA